MRIVIVSTGAPPDPFGGIGTYIEGLLDGLASQDAQVHLVGASRHHRLTRVFQYRGATIRRVLVTPPWARTSLPRSRIGMMAVIARLNIVGAWYARRLHAREKVDLVAVHDWMCAPAGLICAVLFRMPVCYHVHSAEIFRQDRGWGLVAALGRTLNRALSRRARLIMVPSPHTVAGIPTWPAVTTLPWFRMALGRHGGCNARTTSNAPPYGTRSGRCTGSRMNDG